MSGRIKRQACFPYPPALRWMAVLCLLLIVVFGSVQALHFHPRELGTSSKPCNLCPVLHSASPTFSSGCPEIVFSATDYVCPLARSEEKANLNLGALFSRPPPLA